MGWKIQAQWLFAAEGSYSYPLQSTHINSWAHLASDSMGARGTFPGGYEAARP